ncbi:helix-turn-helix domain-containing protein [Raoultibacter timonensis]|uniref:helix-turn-helix domain-containing protein n=1 Tax=Raoultibacter timonensis TaxID=1907662 RepID=UPI001FCB1045|nr:helix-turn-helix transcriptional regulator [Raoultibacter timonensis]
MNNIRSERKRINLGQKEFAEKIGVSHSTVSRWERGVLAPYGSELIAMHQLFGCSTDYLLGISDERNHIRI